MSSVGIKGSTTYVNDTVRLCPVTKLNTSRPQVKLTKAPSTSQSDSHRLLYLLPMPASRAKSGKESIKPPVTPRTMPIPPVKPAKTGTPTAPSVM